MLIFLIQPMTAKILLPYLGSNSTVWTTCMVFFQIMLLIGYLFAHISLKAIETSRQTIFYILFLLCSLYLFPFRFGTISSTGIAEEPIMWLFRNLLATIGFPFLLLSAAGPIIQVWYSVIGAEDSADPYFLYKTSNLGSLAGLLGYPFLIEPWMELSNQFRFWSGAYVSFIVLVGILALFVSRSAPVKIEKVEVVQDDFSVWKKLLLVFFAFIPSSYLLGITTHITYDLAPVPLVWILPLSLYLISFILVFSRGMKVNFTLIQILLFAILVPLIPMFSKDLKFPLWLVIPYHLAVFFMFCTLLHGEIAARRPSVSNLTGFYFCISLGGAMGAVFNGLIAPFVFDTLAEYPLIIALGALILPVDRIRRMEKTSLAFAAYISFGLNICFLLIASNAFDWMKDFATHPIEVFLLAFLYITGFFSPGWFATAVSISFATILLGTLSPQNTVFHGRSFYGTLQVCNSNEIEARLLYHGTTNHGGQVLASSSKQLPFFYYYEESPIGQIFHDLKQRGFSSPVAVVGLGVGALAAYAEPGQEFTFFEIDPLIQKIAQNPQYFTFLASSPGKVNVVIGDGRLELQKTQDNHFGLIIQDAYNSDAIPIHLLTREAMTMYLQKLRKDGLIVFHISTRYLNLEAILGILCRDLNLHAYVQNYDPDIITPKDTKLIPYIYNSRWVIISRYKYNFGNILNNDNWKAIREYRFLQAWTDSYSNIVKIYNWR